MLEAKGIRLHRSYRGNFDSDWRLPLRCHLAEAAEEGVSGFQSLGQTFGEAVDVLFRLGARRKACVCPCKPEPGSQG